MKNEREHHRLSKVLLVGLAAVLGLSLNAFAESGSCVANAASRELDYWVGNWAIAAPGSAQNASSHVTLSLGQCVVVESWHGEKDHVGENIFGYNPESKSWMGFFADNRGHVHVFDHGHVSAGTAEFEGPSRGENGEAVLNRIRIVRLTPDKVEQTWEKSTDNGATWKSQFRLEYTRRSS